MGGQRFSKEDRIDAPVRVGTMVRHRLGVVIKVGNGGAQVRLDDDGKELWLPNSQIKRLEPAPAKEAEPRRVTPPPAAAPARGLVVVPAVEPEPESPATATTLDVQDTVRDMFVALGDDAEAVWRAMGEALVERAQAVVRACERDVADARALLADAEARQAAALDELCRVQKGLGR